MYISPIFLWSTVVTQSCSTSSTRRRGAVWVMLSVTGAWVAMKFPSVLLLQRYQIRSDGVEVVIVEVHRRHQRSGLEMRRVVDEGAEVRRGVGHGPGCDGVAAGDVRQVGAERPCRYRTGHSMAADTGCVLEDVAAFACAWVIHGWLLLVRDPGSKVGRAIGVDAQQHLGVLGSAVLRALAEIEPGSFRVQPHGIDPVGNQVRLSGQARNPEAVIGVSRGHRQIGRRRMPGMTDR